MRRFKDFYLNEAINTHEADINEILVGFYILGQGNKGSWKGFQDAASAKKQLAAKRKIVGMFAYGLRSGQARTMAEEIKKWAKKNGYKGEPVKVYWTARKGVLSKAVGQQVDSAKNPTDTLIEYPKGKFLGISAKSTKQKADIGFKNPGMGTVEKALKINLGKILEDAEKVIIKKHKLSPSRPKRKLEIRADANLQKKTKEAGRKVLSDMADVLMAKLKKMKQKDLLNYILDDWMDAKDTFPPYIKVTGMGSKEPFSANITDPLRNEKLDKLYSSKITIDKTGNDNVIISAGGKRIMMMRPKFASEQMASNIKFSGQP